MTRWRFRRLGIGLGGLLVIALLAPPSGCKQQHPTEPASAGRRLTILALSDLHGEVDGRRTRGGNLLGGAEWIAGYVAAIREETGPGVFLLDGGDSIQGSVVANLSRGAAIVAFYNALGVDAAALGNHEFDHGPEEVPSGEVSTSSSRGALLARLREAHFPFLSGNVHRNGGSWSPPGLLPSIVLKRDGFRMGVVGLSPRGTPASTMPSNVADLRFVDEVRALTALLPTLDATSDVVVVLAHVDGVCDGPRGGELRCGGTLGRIVDALDGKGPYVVVAGHSHHVAAGRVGRTAIVAPGAYGAVLGRVVLAETPDRGVQIHTVDGVPVCRQLGPPPCSAEGPAARYLSRVRPQASVTALLSPYRAERDALCADAIVSAARRLRHDRRVPSPLGFALARALRAAYPSADVAVLNGGGIRSDVPGGSFSSCDLRTVLPYEDAVTEVEMSADELRTLFRIGTSGAHGMLQAAGLRYVVDPAAKGGSDLDGDGAVAPWERSRLVALTTRAGEPLDPARRYRVVLPSFLARGGDDMHTLFAAIPPERVRFATTESVRAAIERALRAAPELLEDAPGTPDGELKEPPRRSEGSR